MNSLGCNNGHAEILNMQCIISVVGYVFFSFYMFKVDISN